MKIANESYADVNKTVENLYDLADKIYSFKQREKLGVEYIFDEGKKYENIVFKTTYCGEPRIYSSLNLPVIISQMFPNPINGILMFGCNYIIHCRELPGIFDLDGRQIYEGSNGTLFVYRYVPSMPGHIFDEALIAPPRIEFAESKDLHYVYQKASELLANQMASQLNLEDELVKLTLVNRITELQTQAYMQGRGYADAKYYDANESIDIDDLPE